MAVAAMLACTRPVLDRVIRAAERLGWKPTPVVVRTSHEYDEIDRDSDRLARAAAKKAGLFVVEGGDSELLIDLDGGRELNPSVLGELHFHFGEYAIQSWPSKSGRGTHVVITFPDQKFTHVEATAPEAALGSDPVRAAVNVVRLKRGVKNPRLLFRPARGLEDPSWPRAAP